MQTTELVSLIIAIVVPIITGAWSYLAATAKLSKDLNQLKEQNKLEIEKIIKQHQFDLETQELKHKLDLEKMDRENKLKMESSAKVTEDEMKTEFIRQVASQFIQTPEVKGKVNQMLLKSINNKKKH